MTSQLIVSFTVVEDAVNKETRLDTSRAGVCEATKVWSWRIYGRQGAWTHATMEKRLREANREAA